MRTLYLDTFSGISGDMVLGLLIDLGVDFDRLEQELAKLDLKGYRLRRRREKRHGIAGTRIEVECDSRGAPSRTWTDIDALLKQSRLDQTITNRARAIFRCLGQAESKIHDIALDEVHFHEVGAIDAIVDVVGASIGLQWLDVADIVCSPLPMSKGMIKGEHGPMPLPAPATLEILRGCPVCDADSHKELVTPTGAAIAATVARFGMLPHMTLDRMGYGVGGWDLHDRPNLLRGILGDSETTSGLEQDCVTMIETHIDDSTPEWLGSLLGQLMDEGALDASFSPLQMKKNRPGIGLTVVAHTADARALAQTILRHSSAIGVRMYDVRRLKLRRESAIINTELGTAEIKLIYEGETLVRIAPEHTSCERLAKSSNRPLPEVFHMIQETAQKAYGLGR